MPRRAIGIRRRGWTISKHEPSATPDKLNLDWAEVGSPCNGKTARGPTRFPGERASPAKAGAQSGKPL